MESTKLVLNRYQASHSLSVICAEQQSSLMRERAIQNSSRSESRRIGNKASERFCSASNVVGKSDKVRRIRGR